MPELKPLPEPEVNNWDTAPLEDLRKEVHGLRLWCGQLFLELREWRARAGDIASAGEQIIKLRSEDDKRYVDLSNKVVNIESDTTLIMDFLGMSGEETAPDDTPQPNNNLAGNPYR